MQSFLNRSAACLGLLLLAGLSHADGLRVTDPWVRLAPPNAPVLAAFMILENPSHSDISVIDVQSPYQAKRVEMHRTMEMDGMMHMKKQAEIPVPARSSTELKPGSWHLMIIGPARIPSPGETVELTLVLSDGEQVRVRAIARKGPMGMNHGSTKHD